MSLSKRLYSLLGTGLEVIKHFSYSTQLSTIYQLLIKTKILTDEEVACFKSLRCWHFNIDEQDKFHAQLI